MEVILREHVDNLGRRGEVVKVAPGLRPQLPAAAQAGPGRDRRQPQADRARAQGRRRARGGGEADRPRRWPRALSQIELTIARRVGETEQLYGSVTTADLAEALAAKGLEIDKRKIHLDEPIKAIGEFTVPVRLLRDVTAQLKVHVVKQDA